MSIKPNYSFMQYTKWSERLNESVDLELYRISSNGIVYFINNLRS